MSVLTSKADIDWQPFDVRLVPLAVIAAVRGTGRLWNIGAVKIGLIPL
jgi:hypothetical protein